MARNVEKAQSMLYRFREAQMEELGIKPVNASRPRFPTSVNNLTEAMKWRGEIIREISLKVSKIQDDTLTEFQVRDLNDEINKLFKEKEKWEHRIKQLGGADYARKELKIFDKDGKPVPAMKGYKYFGRARDLPGVKDLLEKRQQKVDKRDPHRNLKRMDINYFGYFDEEDGLLLKFEKEKQNQVIEEDLQSSNSNDIPSSSSPSSSKNPNTNTSEINEYLSSKSARSNQSLFAQGESLMLHLYVPELHEVEQMLLKRKQKELLEKFL